MLLQQSNKQVRILFFIGWKNWVLIKYNFIIRKKRLLRLLKPCIIPTQTIEFMDFPFSVICMALDYFWS
jgi:hypothetical protein